MSHLDTIYQYHRHQPEWNDTVKRPTTPRAGALRTGADFEAWIKLWRLWHLLFWGELPAEFAQDERTQSRFLSLRTLDSSFEQQRKSVVG